MLLVAHTLVGRRLVTDPVEVVLAGGSHLLRAGLTATLSGGSAIRVCADLDDVAAVASASQDVSGNVLIAYLEQARAAIPHLSAIAEAPWHGRCLVLTASAEFEDLRAALSARVLGYGLLDALHPCDLASAVSVVARGEMWLCAWSTRRLLDLALTGPAPLPLAPPTNASAFVLSAREREVLQLLAKGLDEHAMSEALFLSRNTVKTYVRRIREKLGVSSRTDLLRLSYQLGMIQDRRRAPQGALAPQPPPDARVSEASRRGWSA